MAPEPLPPGSRIGILGGGQLGRMLAMAAARLGMHTHVYEPAADAPAGQVASRLTRAGYDDTTALSAFAASVDVLTYEFENVAARRHRRRGALRAGPPGPAGAGGCAGPRRREDLPERPRPRHRALGGDRRPGRPRRRARPPRHAGDPEDPPARLRRQGPGAARRRRLGRRGLGRGRRSPLGPRRLRRLRARDLGDRRPRPRRHGGGLRPRRERPPRRHPAPDARSRPGSPPRRRRTRC